MTAECSIFERDAYLSKEDATREMHLGDIEALHKAVALTADRVSAHILHYADEHANERGEIQTGLSQVVL
jgi:hypothetical protein